MCPKKGLYSQVTSVLRSEQFEEQLVKQTPGRYEMTTLVDRRGRESQQEEKRLEVDQSRGVEMKERAGVRL